MGRRILAKGLTRDKAQRTPSRGGFHHRLVVSLQHRQRIAAQNLHVDRTAAIVLAVRDVHLAIGASSDGNRTAEEFVVEQTGSAQHGVAQKFRIDSPQTLTPQQPVVGIDLLAQRDQPERASVRFRLWF